MDRNGRTERIVEIVNQRGLHARASAKFVRCAVQFDAEILVTRDGQSVAGTSIMGLLALGAGPGSQIGIAAEGPEAEAAVAALSRLVEERFGEE
ncbi:phosphocarrier protein [Tepidamorphus gemmatus]|jgi:phosphocarrier protein HPr|uniref:Phosphocarrier protein n=1 Tax=Tepidamorphus gemmatus TaxID=747076 RepID=A0A4R3MCS3_9HYPH|nr:HPr family phosphocarrier protein [Tepidamorphus gemmatus]TCT10673.1 phosphocarrier protein [Tepidamorphus gemmatus]